MRRLVQLNMAMLLVLVNQAWAQSRTVSGRVTDAANGQALPGVSVVGKETNTGVATTVNSPPGKKPCWLYLPTSKASTTGKGDTRH